MKNKKNCTKRDMMKCRCDFRGLMFLLASAFMMLFFSCQSGPVEDASSDECHTVCFSVTNYRQVNFEDLSTTGSTRAMTHYEIATLGHLLFAVYDAESGEQVVAPIQRRYNDYRETPSEYPKFSVSLPYGRYRVLVLGFNGSRACDITSLNSITWEDEYVPNTFLYYDEFKLDKDASLSQTIMLKRVVTAFSLTATDAIPAGVKKMRVESTAGSSVLDAATGFAPKTTGRMAEIAVPADSIGKAGVRFTVYLFLPEEQTEGEFLVQAIGKDGSALSEKRFSQVPLGINRLTMWSGELFGDSTGEEPVVQEDFGVEWDINWADTIQYVP